jgi:hypothetical protein
MMVDYLLALTIMQQSEYGRRERRRLDWTLGDEDQKRWSTHWPRRRGEPQRR